jgi:carbamoyltransferase
MLVTVPLKAARRTPAVAIPAVTHVDYSARVQTVDREVNPRFHALLTEFGRRTGCPVLVNTSFNVRGEPVVCTPEDAFRCFLGTGLDVLVVEDCVLYKEQQEAAGRGEAACWFEPD